MQAEKQKMTLSVFYQQHPLRVLLIEDRDDYADMLYKLGKDLHFDVKHVYSLEEGKEHLATKDGEDIRGVILDIRCMRKKDQKEWDQKFLAEALDYFRRTRPALPLVAITGYSDEYNEATRTQIIRVFSKDGEEEEMFECLRNEALDYEKVKIRFNYQDIFETVDKYFDKKLGEMLVSCIRDMDSEKREVIKGTIANLRILQEAVYIALHKINEKMVPREFIYDEHGELNVNNKNIVKHLTGNFNPVKRKATTDIYVKYGSYEDRLLYFVYKVCSSELHLPVQETSRYTVQALLYSFLDMVLWLRRLGQGKQ